MPIWGVPVLDHVLRLLHGWGVREVVINLHHLPNEVINHCLRPGSAALQCGIPGLKVSFSHEPEILGTGGALQKCRWFFDDEPFWLLNADVAADLEPRALLKAFRPGRTLSSVWLHPSAGPRSVEAERGYVTNWQSKRPGAAGTYTFCGLHLVSPTILDFMPPSGPASIITAYEKAMAKGHRIAGVVVPGSFWADIGTPAQYVAAHRQALERFRAKKAGRNLVDRATLSRMERLPNVDGFAAIGANVTIARGTKICDSVLWDGSIARGNFSNAIVGSSTEARGDVGFIALRAEDALDVHERAAVKWPLEKTVAYPLGPRGSARTFTRLQHGSKAAILIRYNPKREENRLYVGHARFLRRIGLPVPAVLYDDPEHSVTLFEDLGDRSVQVALGGLSQPEVRALYEKILDHVVVFHERGVRQALARKLVLVPPFRPRLYRWEHELFIENFLRKRMRLTEAELAPLRRDLARVGRHLAHAPPVLVHRDLQSSNILLRQGEPWFIDFQGMRYGPAVYDLASLLCDPYVELPGPLQEELVERYARRSRDPESIRRLFWHAAIQRLGQALGAYGRLSASADTEYFKKYIPPAMEMLARAVSRVNDLPALARWCGDTARGVGLE